MFTEKQREIAKTQNKEHVTKRQIGEMDKREIQREIEETDWRETFVWSVLENH